MMELQPIYALTIAKFDASEFVEYGKSLFDGQIELTSTKGAASYKTSIEYYDSGRTNSAPFLNSEPLREFICECSVEFATTLGYSTEPYEPSASIWINEMTSGSHHKLHNHYGTNFSGCFYIEVPENSGFISFQTLLERYDKAPIDIREYTLFNSGTWTVETKKGDLLMWESFLQHQVKPMVYEGKRLCLGFDVIMNRKKEEA
jgi:uncharacterized protein (TIGR02466 family)